MSLGDADPLPFDAEFQRFRVTERGITHRPARRDPRGPSLTCPTCGHRPTHAGEHSRHRLDLATTWLYPHPNRPSQLVERAHCARCQPHQRIATLDCLLCGDGPLLVGALTELDADGLPPAPAQAWLTARGWRLRPRPICPRHPR